MDQKCVTNEESVRARKSTRRALSVRFAESLVSSFFETITVVQLARRPKSLLMRWHFLEEASRQCTLGDLLLVWWRRFVMTKKLVELMWHFLRFGF